MMIARYRKLVAGVVAVIAFAGNQLWGWEPTDVLIEQIINGVIGVLLLVGIERSTNAQAHPTAPNSGQGGHRS